MSNSPVNFNDPTGHKQESSVYTEHDDVCNPGDTSCSWVQENIDKKLKQKDAKNKSSDTCGQLGVYSPKCPGWHEYTTTNIVCPANLQCSEAEMKNYLLRFAYPGQDSSQPIVSGQTHSVNWPGTNIPMGPLGAIISTVKNGGLTTVNRTLPTHIFHDGVVERTISQLPTGSWIVTTHGYGNNLTHNIAVPLRDDWGAINISVSSASLNGWGGPIIPGGVNIFDNLDAQMLSYIETNR